LRNLSKRCLIGATMLGILIFALMMAGRAYIFHQARTVIGEISDFDKASDPAAAAISFMQEHQNHFATKVCDRDFCQYQFVFTNRLLSTLHLTTRSEIEVLVSVYHERLESVAVDFTSGVFKKDSPVVHVQEDFCRDRMDIGCDHFAINPHGRDATPTWNGDVQFGQLATEAQKRAAWALNINCIEALHGCRDISELNPAIWKRPSPNKVSSRMHSSADSIAEAAQPVPD
jgi:hypothetical protein